jgi:GTP cyclohydrolase I
MNLHMPDLDRKPSRDEAEAALATLKLWAARASEAEIVDLDPQAGALVGQGYPVMSRDYPEGFVVDGTYKDSLPDLQNGPSSLIVGEKAVIQHVGISNFRLPIRYRTRQNGPLALETSVTGTVSLEAEKKGINMSRIMRSFYAHAEREFSFQVIEHALEDYMRDLGSFDARIQMRFSFPVKVDSLRSGLRKRIMHLDFVYSSTCPCSLELSEHARRTRGQLATPHSQRSVARISVEVKDGPCLWFEDLIDIARAAVPTETQVMVKREDEQAFAELNAANPIFVEDAARSFCAALLRDGRIGDFRIVASHQESLHSHDAVSVLTEGPTFAAESLDPRLFASLYHVG